jgi:hypothetical protein
LSSASLSTAHTSQHPARHTRPLNAIEKGTICTHRSTIVATIAGYLRRSQPKKSGTPIRGWAGRLAASACLACAVWCAGSCAGCGQCLRAEAAAVAQACCRGLRP